VSVSDKLKEKRCAGCAIPIGQGYSENIYKFSSKIIPGILTNPFRPFRLAIQLERLAALEGRFFNPLVMSMYMMELVNRAQAAAFDDDK
jgi:hypothetical protein